MSTIYHLLDEQETFSERNGGAISRWAANVLRDGTEVVICPSFDASWDFPTDRIYCLPYWRLTDYPVHPVLYRLPWTLQKKIYLLVFHALLRKLKRGDVLYIHNRPECASVLATVAEKHGIKIVLHMHNSHLLRANRGQLAALKKTPIVFCSEFLSKEAHSALPGHFESTYVVHNGADCRKFRVAERPANAIPEIIWTGRLVPYKGVHILLDAMQRLKHRGIAVRCKIVGGAGFGDSRTTRYVRSLRRMRPDNTEFTGYVSGDGLAELLRRADIYCCPSIWNDPFPLAPLEAMATGLPVVASDTGGLREMFAHGGGVLIPPNDPEELSLALQALVEHEPTRRKLSTTGRASFCSHFLWSTVRAQYEKVVNTVRS
jgi:spore coat protein SA